MDNLQLKAVIAGICFGLHPLLLNRGGLSGNLLSAVYALIVFIFVLPFGLGEIRNLSHANWLMLFGAGAICATGTLFYTGYLAKASPTNVGLLIVLMIVMQTVVTAIYQAIMDKGVSLTKLCGFVLAAAAIVLLNKK